MVWRKKRSVLFFISLRSERKRDVNSSVRDYRMAHHFAINWQKCLRLALLNDQSPGRMPASVSLLLHISHCNEWPFTKQQWLYCWHSAAICEPSVTIHAITTNFWVQQNVLFFSFTFPVLCLLFLSFKSRKRFTRSSVIWIYLCSYSVAVTHFELICFKEQIEFNQSSLPLIADSSFFATNFFDIFLAVHVMFTETFDSLAINL